MFITSGCSRSRLYTWITVLAATASAGVICAAQAASQPATQPAAPEAAAAKAAVSIENFNFTQPTLTVAQGATVTWTNHDDVPHTVTSKADPQVFDSGPVDTDEKFSFTFTKPGNYAYYCKLHSHMKGTVTVK